MKKEYNKPYIGVESFQLNAALATACSTSGYIAINYGPSTCAFPPSSETPGKGQFFSLINCQFDLTGPNEDGNDTDCYHGPLLSGNITFTWS